ncbi:hypothetical protein MBLNU457_g0955t1 [Dothideomycetes sp. NU457]
MALTADEIDDVLYLVRVNEQDELKSFISELAQKHSVTEAAILEASVDAESKNTAIHFCAANGLTGLLTTLLELAKSTKQSEFINARNDAGNTPLHWAALNGHLETCKALISAGADMWIRNNAGNLAIFEAERAGKDDVVAYLLQVGGTEKEQEVEGEGGSAVNMTMSAGETVPDEDMDVDGEEEGEGGVEDAGVKLQGASLNG